MTLIDLSNIELRECLHCGKIFWPRPYQVKIGAGKYCSRQCSTKYAILAGHTPESNRKRGESYKRSLAGGKFVRPAGPNHAQWKGGLKAAQKRRVESGKALAGLRKYRAENPHKIREWSVKRRGLKTGRLPKGTIARLLEAQNGKCKTCSLLFIVVGYHVDHIIPISKGGKHEPSNIQLLCPTCNVRKSAKLDWKPDLESMNACNLNFFNKFQALIEAGRVTFPEDTVFEECST